VSDAREIYFSAQSPPHVYTYYVQHLTTTTLPEAKTKAEAVCGMMKAKVSRILEKEINAALRSTSHTEVFASLIQQSTLLY
jgi:predicted secreted protein